ncbi:hypothetical protein BpHYR1_033503 [Brachionus plicatilis]|uniref:Uncharacterized protein n=1 Tax=Brachionus plicatilis TaxID=10195 RepID=A0A3M7QWM5_BRAPC|nr:hypothetical protein BpHYR1_033503 [Brachionus plicatilis]
MIKSDSNDLMVCSLLIQLWTGQHAGPSSRCSWLSKTWTNTIWNKYSNLVEHPRYCYWTDQKSIEILVDKRTKRKFKFNRYTVNTKIARPESYFEDMHTASHCHTDA